MNLKGFLVDALTSALELGIGMPDDVVRHVTPDVLAAHLPRPLWARLFTACLGAARVDAQLVIETLGIPNLCEHVPSTIMWACIAEIGARSLGNAAAVTPAASVVIATPAPAPVSAPVSSVTATTTAIGSGPARAAVLAPPPDERPPAPAPAPPPRVVGPSIPAPATVTGPESLADVISEIESADAAEPRLGLRSQRPAAGSRFRQSSTSTGRLGATRRPVAASSSSPTPTTANTRRGQTEVESDFEPDPTINRSDDELVEWPHTEGNGTPAVPPVDEDFSDLGRRKR